MSAEISRPNFAAPRNFQSGEYHVQPESINKFNIEKYVIPFVVPILSSLLGAAASYTAIKKDIELNQARIAKIETFKVISEEKINNLKTEIAVMQVKLMTLAESDKRRR